MASPSFSTEGLVVARGDLIERHCDLSLFSTQRGLLKCRRRLASNKSSMVPDLFSDIEALLNPIGGGQLYFVGEWRLLKSRSGIGLDYRRLEAAGALARMVSLNARWLATFDEASVLLGKALDALDEGAPCEAARFKAIFLLVRSEGYPVEEDWRMNRVAEDRDALRYLLLNPIKSCELSTNDIKRWRKDLEKWVVAETDFVL
jgi:hypothetical protein